MLKTPPDVINRFGALYPDDIQKPSYISLPLSAIIKPETSIKSDNPQKLEKLRSSIETFGQIMPVQVREMSPTEYGCISGSKILNCMVELGYENVLAINYGIISEAEARRIAVATGLHDFEPDRVNLALILKGLSEHYPIEQLLETIPMTRFELETYIAYPDFSWDRLLAEEEERGRKKANKAQPYNKEGAPDTNTGFELPNLFLLDESDNPYLKFQQ